MTAERKNHVPAYRKHNQSGQAIVTLTDGLGQRHDVLLGKHGTKASRVEYARVIAEWEANGRRPAASVADITVAELIAAFWPFVETHYRHPDGTPTTEVCEFKMALRPANHLYGNTPAKDFGPLALKAVRLLMVEGYEHPNPKYGHQPALARGVINKRIGRVKRLFGWAVENEMVPPSLYHGLTAVKGLKRGRSDARETVPVAPVARAVVEDTLPLLQPTVADMVRLLMLSGMRPGELVIIRACDIDTTGRVWLYRPGSHKTEHHGYERIIPLGPKAQEIVRDYLTTSTADFLFNPAKVREAQNARRRQERRTPLWPSHVEHQKKKRKNRPRRSPKDRYTVTSLARSITEAIKRHNTDTPEAEHVPHWHPHQVRHLAALELKREGGLDFARAVLGHRSPCVTEMYATLDVAKACETVAKIG